ncbi:MAG: murein L,D-transpeptidase catalytic domain family protein [Bacteroidales bacterium]|jgi:hypothetical protein|nr:murein L,D-transpeptidase catalytic domain family protein [Bacteroidales bacterium]
MRTTIFSIAFILLSALTFPIGNASPKKSLSMSERLVNETELIYEQMNLKGLIDFNAFEAAYVGYKKLNNNKNNLLTIIDFNLPSTEKRMYVLDLSKKEVLYVTHVAHGRNSGGNYATSFSNKNGSYQSSLGFYRTAETYNGGNGYSLRLDGLEKGINDLARPRAVVIHGADYCNENFIKSTGRLGRSFGCPALPQELNKPIINTIKDGSLIFIYADKPEYYAMTKVL